MPFAFRFALALLVIVLASCGEDEGGTGATGASTGCEGNDNLSRLWGTFARGELLVFAGPQTPGPNWVLFSHPTQPLLGFLHPPDWSGAPLFGGSDVGVDLLRADGGGFYHNFTSFDPSSSVSVSEWLDQSIIRGLGLMGATGGRTEVCSLPPMSMRTSFGGGRIVTASVVVAGDSLILSGVSLTFFDGLTGNGVAVQSFAGRIDQFNQIANDVFFPIIDQLLIGTGQEDRDTDFDGVIDRLDEFPLDPTRQ